MVAGLQGNDFGRKGTWRKRFVLYFCKKIAVRIIIREREDAGRRFCRVSIGTPEEMPQFANVLKSMKVETMKVLIFNNFYFLLQLFYL